MPGLPYDVTARVISVDNNAITSIPIDAFTNLSALEELKLHTNAITEIPNGVFDGLTALTLLSLYDNLISVIPANVFSDLTSITAFQVAYNNPLISIPDDAFNVMTEPGPIGVIWMTSWLILECEISDPGQPGAWDLTCDGCNGDWDTNGTLYAYEYDNINDVHTCVEYTESPSPAPTPAPSTSPTEIPSEFPTEIPSEIPTE